MDKEALGRYLKYREENLNEWQGVLNNIFPSGIPETAVWTNFSEIVKTLKLIGKGEHTCHMFSPNGGGLDLAGAEAASESGCIKILTEGSSDIIKPERLIFQSFSNQPVEWSDSNKPVEWSYFRLETDKLQPISDGFNRDVYEQLTLLPNGEYDAPSVYENFDRDEQPELIGCKRVMRYTKNSFVMFAKGSVYNRISATYDGRHNKMNADEFREYISTMITELAKIETAELKK